LQLIKDIIATPFLDDDDAEVDKSAKAKALGDKR
jgi:hypothetical protein